MLTLDLVNEARLFLAGRVRRTPVEYSSPLSERLGVPVWLKLECLQMTGSFKVRGALFAMAKLREEGIEHVATCSAGNHGRGIAHAARELDMQATIYIPTGVDESKVRGMIDLGAEVLVSEFFGYDETEAWAIGRAGERGLPFLSAYDDPVVMAGNGGSIALEVLEQVPGARTFVMPAGGGGHGAGFAFTVTEKSGKRHFILCQHEQSPAFQLSLERGHAVTELPGIKTLAGGLEGGFGVQTFEILQPLVDRVALVSEVQIREAMKWMIEKHQIIVEGSAAAGVAACLQEGFEVEEGPVVIFISGRNVSASTIRDILS